MEQTHINDAIKVLKDTTRRRILRLLAEEGPLEYSEILRRLGLKSTGRLNYHLKILKDFIVKDASGRYRLNEKGMLLYRFMTNFQFNTVAGWARPLLIITFTLMAFSTILTFYSCSSCYWCKELAIVGKSVYVTSLILLTTSILLIDVVGVEVPKLNITGLLRVNLYPILANIIIILVGYVFYKLDLLGMSYYVLELLYNTTTIIMDFNGENLRSKHKTCISIINYTLHSIFISSSIFHNYTLRLLRVRYNPNVNSPTIICVIGSCTNMY